MSELTLGNRSGKPVGIGSRVGARLITACISMVGLAIIYYPIITNSGNGAVWLIAMGLGMVVNLGVGVWQLVLAFAKSTTIGGQMRHFKWVRTDTGEDAKGMVVVKYLVQGLFEGATLMLGTISYFVSYRDGAHWLDRAFNLAAVETESIREAGGTSQAPKAGASAAGAASGGGPKVLPVQLPQRPLQPAAPPAPSGAPRPVMAPMGQPASPPSGPSPKGGSPFTPANPWALPSPGTPAAAPSRPAQPSFTPPGQAPLTRPMTPPAAAASVATVAPPAPPAARPVSPSLVNDETVIDPDMAAAAAAVVILDDDTRVTVDGPLVVGRNPAAPASHPTARPLQLVDESMRLSKSHFVLLPVDGGVAAFDMGATNGISLEVDGQKVRLPANEVHPLPPGAVLHFGGRSLRVAP